MGSTRYVSPSTPLCGLRGVVRVTDSTLGLQHIPFDYSNKATFATKLSVYLISGFAMPPFLAMS